MEGLATEVIEHASDPPSPWAGYLRCLTDIPACSHLLIVQDDALPVPNFAEAVRRVAVSQPETPVCLFLSKNPRGATARASRAFSRNERYVVLNPCPFVPIVAVLWPRQKAEEFREWAQSGVPLPGDPNPRADDSVLAAWCKRTRQWFVVCCPSLVDHLSVPSVKGTHNVASSWKAAFLAKDGLDYEW